MEQHVFVRNRDRLVSTLEDNSLLVLFSGERFEKSADELYPFSPNRNFYYVTGLASEDMILLVSKLNGSVTETVFIPQPDITNEKWNGHMLTPEEATAASGIENVGFTEDFYGTLGRQLGSYKYRCVYLDIEQRTWKSPTSAVNRFASEIKAKYPQLSVDTVYPILCSQRTIKSPEEVEVIRTALSITKDGILEMMKHAHEGVVEYELEAAFYYKIRSQGAKFAYEPIVGTGKNATILHYLENSQQTQQDQMVLADIGAEYNYYKADLTRTFPMSGKFTPRQRRLYDIVLKAEEETIQAIKPGLPHIELDNTTRKVLAAGLKDVGLIQTDEELTEYYFYNVSHYLGLDTHDVGEYDTLKPGMVLTIEPGVYIPEESIGIRIEDVVLVTETGYEVLSRDLIKTAEDIEAFMQK